MPKITLGIASGLINLLPGFKTNTFADHQRIEGVLRTLNATQFQRNELIKKFFADHQLPETESIGAEHPLGRELFALINRTETALSKTDVAQFTMDELNASVDGLGLSYADRAFLVYWLVK